MASNVCTYCTYSSYSLCCVHVLYSMHPCMHAMFLDPFAPLSRLLCITIRSTLQSTHPFIHSFIHFISFHFISSHLISSVCYRFIHITCNTHVHACALEKTHSLYFQALAHPILYRTHNQPHHACNAIHTAYTQTQAQTQAQTQGMRINR